MTAALMFMIQGNVFYYTVRLIADSEKSRIPSWTDRIVFKGESISSLMYDRVEIDISDHKPVKSVLNININQKRPVWSDFNLIDL